ncbi:uncharacterized protein [Rutidosis leptorrhynchoides]|uniref:uncharacterized protein n=1 Tax=Rutidosis leptorrhynchoides TaxID=125765 RepID=UPI003A999A55
MLLVFRLKRISLFQKKVEVFVWRARRNRLPVLSELDKRGIDLHSVLCPLCDDEVETVNHALLSCKKVREIWEKVFMWWDIVYNQQSLEDILGESPHLQCSEDGAKIWQAMIWASEDTRGKISIGLIGCTIPMF